MVDLEYTYEEAKEASDGEFEVDGDWDTLTSNPEYREAYNDAERDGYRGEEAHIVAHLEVYEEEFVREKYDDEAVEEVVEKAEGRFLSGSRLDKVNPPRDYEKADDALLSAHKKAVQWKANEPFDQYDVSKAPGIWESQDEVPDWVLYALERLIRQGDVIWGGGYERLPPDAEAEIQDVLEDRMTQPQGWSLDSLLQDLKDHYPNRDDEYLLNILRNETSAVLNTAREEAYAQREDADEYVFDWIGPDDHRTTDTCKAVKSEIDSRGGSVPIEQLKEILYEKALEHQGAEGTPERVDDWQPHYQCRHTFTRRVQSI